MTAKRKQTDDDINVEIAKIETRDISFNILGRTPLIFNRQSEKAKRQLMLPPLPQNKAQRVQTLKHNPVEEFRASPYTNRREPDAPTWLHTPGGAWKKSVSQAAIDIPGASKAQIGRLVSLATTVVNVWGTPYMRADMVRQAGIAKTPDVRFRACLPNWAARVTYTYIPAIISPNSLANLVTAAGVICGIGDYRVEKGAGDFGQFKIVPEDDEEWHHLVATEGREIQMAAMENPLFFDDDTRELVEWFDEEIDRRRRTPEIALDAAEDDEIEVDPALDVSRKDLGNGEELQQ